MIAVVITGQNMDPGLTPAQGRVVFHQERLLRSTGTHPGVAAEYRHRCALDNLPVAIAEMSRGQCRLALKNLEDACLAYNLHRVRDIRTQWEGL